MIPRNELIDSAHLWYDEPTSTPHDRTLCALATLRMIGSEILGHRGSNRSTMLDRTDGLLNILLNDIDKWHSRWCSLPEMGMLNESIPCHALTIQQRETICINSSLASTEQISVFCSHSSLFMRPWPRGFQRNLLTSSL